MSCAIAEADVVASSTASDQPKNRLENAILRGSCSMEGVESKPIRGRDRDVTLAYGLERPNVTGGGEKIPSPEPRVPGNDPAGCNRRAWW